MIISHIKSLFSKTNGKWNKKRLLNAFALFRLRHGRGLTFIGELKSFIQSFAVYITPMMLAGISLPKASIIVCTIGFGYLFVTYVIGYYDMEKVKLWQKESVLTQTRTNPEWIWLKKEIETIKNKLEKNGR